MTEYDYYLSIPIGSLLVRDPAEEKRYMDHLVDVPPLLASLVVSPQTGAVIRGIVKNHDVPVEQSTEVARAILQIAYGEKRVSDLAGMLSSQLQVANDKAQRIAQEIEKELLAPVMHELGQQQRGKKSATSVSSGSVGEGPRNLLDLQKKKSSPPPPPAPPTIRN